MAIHDFIKNHHLLREDHRLEKGFATFEHLDVAMRIKELSRTCVLALVGPYGSGKSTALHRAKEKLEDTTWLQFDAWRYPERKALWDGLIIETAKQLGSSNLKKVKRALDGNEAAVGKWGGITTSIFASAADLMPKGALEWMGDKLHMSLPSLSAKETKEVKEAGPVADKLVKNLFGRSAAKRAYEFEKILTDLLVSVKTSRIVLVVEDVDRSGADGLHFLETLSFYLNNNKRLTEKTVIAVAPVSEYSYRNNDELYLKCVDYIELFRPRGANLDGFIEEIFVGLDMHPPELSDLQTPLTLPAYQTKYFLEGLFNTFPEQMSMRKLKMIIREAASAYKLMQIDGHAPDWRIVVCVQAMKHIRDAAVNVQDPPTVFDHYIHQGQVSNNNLFANTLAAIVDERRQDEEPNRGSVIIANKYWAKGMSLTIQYDFNEGGMPQIKRYESNDGRGGVGLYIQGYYFKY